MKECAHISPNKHIATIPVANEEYLLVDIRRFVGMWLLQANSEK
jgi:hypothetical protein